MNNVNKLLFVATIGCSGLQAMEDKLPLFSAALSTRALSAHSPDSEGEIVVSLQSMVQKIDLRAIPSYQGPRSASGRRSEPPTPAKSSRAPSTSFGEERSASTLPSARSLSRASNTSSSSKRCSAVSESLAEAACSRATLSRDGSETDFFLLQDQWRAGIIEATKDACYVVIQQLEDMLRDGHMNIARSSSDGVEAERRNELLEKCREFLTKQAKKIQSGMCNCIEPLQKMRGYLSPQCRTLTVSFWNNLIAALHDIIEGYKDHKTAIKPSAVFAPITGPAASPEVAPVADVADPEYLEVTGGLSDAIQDGAKALEKGLLTQEELIWHIDIFLEQELAKDPENMLHIGGEVNYLAHRFKDRLLLPDSFWASMQYLASSIQQRAKDQLGKIVGK